MPVSHYSSFTTDVTSGTAPLTVNFTDTSGSPPATAWNWDFGDLTPINTTQNPSHIFTLAGTYNVILDADTGIGFGNPSLPTVITVSAPAVAYGGGKFQSLNMSSVIISRPLP